jgi:hypothetical protein
MPEFAWRDWRKPQKSSISIAGRRGRDLNPGPPEYETGVLITVPRRSLGAIWTRKIHSTTFSADYKQKEATFIVRPAKCRARSRLSTPLVAVTGECGARVEEWCAGGNRRTQRYHHEPQFKSPRSEPRPPRWEFSVQSLELWYQT